MIVLVSLIVLGIFRMVHPYIAIHTNLVSHIRVEKAVTRMRTLGPRLA